MMGPTVVTWVGTLRYPEVFSLSFDVLQGKRFSGHGPLEWFRGGRL